MDFWGEMPAEGIVLSSHFTSYITGQLQFITALLHFHQLIQFMHEANCTCSHAEQHHVSSAISVLFVLRKAKREITLVEFVHADTPSISILAPTTQSCPWGEMREDNRIQAAGLRPSSNGSLQGLSHSAPHSCTQLLLSGFTVALQLSLDPLLRASNALMSGFYSVEHFTIAWLRKTLSEQRWMHLKLLCGQFGNNSVFNGSREADI